MDLVNIILSFANTWHIFTRGSDADTNLFRGMQFVGLTDEKGETFGSRVRSLLNLDTVKTPEILHPSSIDELYAQLKTKSPDFEGYVLSYLDPIDGKTAHRMKLKQESYVSLHHIRTKQMTVLDAVRIVATNETAEVLSYMPEHKDTFDSIQTRLTALAEEIDAFLASNRHLPRKEFAVLIPKTAELKWLYFDLYQGKYLNTLHGMYNATNHGKVAGLFSN